MSYSLVLRVTSGKPMALKRAQEISLSQTLSHRGKRSHPNKGISSSSIQSHSHLRGTNMGSISVIVYTGGDCLFCEVTDEFCLPTGMAQFFASDASTLNIYITKHTDLLACSHPSSPLLSTSSLLAFLCHHTPLITRQFNKDGWSRVQVSHCR